MLDIEFSADFSKTVGIHGFGGQPELLRPVLSQLIQNRERVIERKGVIWVRWFGNREPGAFVHTEIWLGATIIDDRAVFRYVRTEHPEAL